MARRWKYRVLLLDIDGTLVCAQREQIDRDTLVALEHLRARGVTVAFATGRNLAEARPETLGGFIPDYYICISGAYVAAGDGRVIWHHPMSQRQFDDILRVAEREGGCSVGFAFPERNYMYTRGEIYRAHYERVHGDTGALQNSPNCTRHLQGLPYAAFGIIPPEKLRLFTELPSGIDTISFPCDSYDLCQYGITKATGAAHLLAALGLQWESLVAVGDGENDIELLEAAGLGVAMGNAADTVKAHADTVTATVMEDGVLKVIDQYFS